VVGRYYTQEVLTDGAEMVDLASQDVEAKYVDLPIVWIRISSLVVLREQYRV
jgi:hypothetical protein